MNSGDELAGRFRITKRLKSGGMADVWLADDSETGETVAVKVMQATTSRWETFLSDEERDQHTVNYKRFVKEWETLCRAQGPGSPRAIHAELEPSRPYFVMQYIRGADLNELLKKRRPAQEATVSIGVQLLRIIERIAAARIVHRDVKPHNVVIAEDGILHLIDFGIALPTDSGTTRLTRPGQTPGTMGYMAPEIIRGERNPTTLADVYGAGCMLYRCITGRRLFEPTDDRSVEDQHRLDAPPRIDSEEFPIPPELADLVRRMTDLEPANRATAAEALSYLVTLLPPPGAPAPDPAMTPDPTLPFREPSTDRAAHAAPPLPGGRRRPRVRRARTLSTARFECLLERAEQELAQWAPGPHCADLAAERSAVEKEWDAAGPLMVRACLAEADRARIEGVWPRAATLYREVRRTLHDTSDPASHAFVLEARVGEAECRLPEHRDTESAYSDWAAVVTEVRELPDPTRRLVRRCREFGAELGELGPHEAVADLLAGLPED